MSKFNEAFFQLKLSFAHWMQSELACSCLLSFVSLELACWNDFLIKLQVLRHAALFKRDSNTDIFLWILRNVQEQLFYRTLWMAASELFYDSSAPVMSLVYHLFNLTLKSLAIDLMKIGLFWATILVIIFRHFLNNLVQVWITTSKAILDI